MAMPGMLVDPVQAALAQGLSMAQPPQPAAAEQTLPVVPPADTPEPPLGPAPAAQPTGTTAANMPAETAASVVDAGPPPPPPAATPVPEAPPAAPQPNALSPDEEAEIARYEQDYIDIGKVKLEDVVPQELLTELRGRMKKGRSLSEAFQLASLAMMDPKLYGEQIQQEEAQKNAAANTLLNLETSVMSYNKEVMRQARMAARERRENLTKTKAEEAKQGEIRYRDRQQAVINLFGNLGKAGVDIKRAGIRYPTEAEVKDENSFFQWLAETSQKGAAQDTKDSMLRSLAGFDRTSPLWLAAQTGADPSSAVYQLLGNHFTAAEVAELKPTIDSFIAAAGQQRNMRAANLQRTQTSTRWMDAQITKTNTDIQKVQKQLAEGGTLTPKVLSDFMGTLTLRQGQLVQLENSLNTQLAIEMQKSPVDQERLGQLQESVAEVTRLQLETQNTAALVQSRLNQAMVQPDLGARMQTFLPEAANTMRQSVAKGEFIARGVPDSVRVEAMAAAADPVLWFEYLKGDPLEGGRPNPYRQAFWSAIIYRVAADTGQYNAQDIFNMLNAGAAGQSRADQLVGRDITLPPGMVGPVQMQLDAKRAEMMGAGAPFPPNPQGGGGPGEQGQQP